MIDDPLHPRRPHVRPAGPVLHPSPRKPGASRLAHSHSRKYSLAHSKPIHIPIARMRQPSFGPVALAPVPPEPVQSVTERDATLGRPPVPNVPGGMWVLPMADEPTNGMLGYDKGSGDWLYSVTLRAADVDNELVTSALEHLHGVLMRAQAARRAGQPPTKPTLRLAR